MHDQSELILRRSRCRIPGRPVRYTESNITAASNGGSDGEERAEGNTVSCVGILHPGGENVGENGNSNVRRKRSTMERKKDGGQEPADSW